MSVIATALKHLIAAGVSGDELLRAVAEMEADIRAEPRERSAGAIRQERYRRNKASQVTDVTVRDEPSPLSRPPNEINSNPPTHTPPDMNTRARKADPFPCPEWTTEAVWSDLKANRKAKRLANTPTAHAKLLRDIERWTNEEWPPGRVLEAVAARGWAAAEHDPRGAQNVRPLRPTDSFAGLRGSRPNSALDMVLESERELAAEAQREGPGADWSARAALPSH